MFVDQNIIYDQSLKNIKQRIKKNNLEKEIISKLT